MAQKEVTFCLPDYVYEHIQDYVHETLRYVKDTPEEFLKCSLINRLIERGILDEFGEPNPLCLPPKLSLSLDSLREIVPPEPLPKNFPSPKKRGRK